MRRPGQAIFFALGLWVLFCTGVTVFLFLRPAVEINVFGRLVVLWLAASVILFVAIHGMRMMLGRRPNLQLPIAPSGAESDREADRAAALERWGRGAGLSAIAALVLYAAAGMLGLLG